MLKYICHDESSKPIFLKVRSMAQNQVHDIEMMNKAFGSGPDDISECFNGLQNAIDDHPRINTGFLSTYFRVEKDADSVKVFHVTESKKHLVCEVIKVKEGGEQ